MTLVFVAAVTVCLAHQSAAQPTWGYGLQFDGTDDYVETAAAVIPDSGDFTVECWAFCPTAPNSACEILSQGSAGNAFYLGRDAANNVRLGDSWVATDIPFPLGAWHHLAVVKTADSTCLYIDGVLRTNRVFTLANPAASTGLRIGGQYGELGEDWPGRIDEVRVWNVARTQEEIQAGYNHPLTGNEMGLRALYRFDEAAGVRVYDATTNHLDGTLMNRPRWAPSYWWPTLALNGPNPLTNQQFQPFVDPGAVVKGSAVAIAAGFDISLALKSDGTVVNWGIGTSNRPPPTGLSDVVSLAAGS